MFKGYRNHKHIKETDFKMASSSGVLQMLSSGLKGIAIANDEVSRLLMDARDNSNLESKINEVIVAQLKANATTQQLVTLLHSNAFLTSIIMDNVVPNANQTTAMNSITVVPMTESEPASVGILTGTSVRGGVTRQEDNSTITRSIKDILSPMQMTDFDAPADNSTGSLESDIDPLELFEPSSETAEEGDIDMANVGRTNKFEGIIPDGYIGLSSISKPLNNRARAGSVVSQVSD